MFWMMKKNIKKAQAWKTLLPLAGVGLLGYSVYQLTKALTTPTSPEIIVMPPLVNPKKEIKKFDEWLQENTKIITNKKDFEKFIPTDLKPILRRTFEETQKGSTAVTLQYKDKFYLILPERLNKYVFLHELHHIKNKAFFTGIPWYGLFIESLALKPEIKAWAFDVDEKERAEKERIATLALNAYRREIKKRKALYAGILGALGLLTAAL